jgi:hypothetical protein
MAKIDRFMIAPFDGEQHDTRPWMLQEQAFSDLINAYIFRGRVRKRFGSRVMNAFPDAGLQSLHTRLRINIGTTDAWGDFQGIIGGVLPLVHPMPGTIFKIGQMFSVGDKIFTAYQLNGDMKTTSAVATATFNADPADPSYSFIDITGNNENPNTAVYFYPSEPVMGIVQYDALAINDEPTVAFDTQFAYQYDGNAWERIGDAVWTGNDHQFFWASNWRGVDAQDYILYAVNGNPADFIKYWNGIAWTNLNPTVNTGGTTLKSSRIIVSFKGRLVCLNTFEGIGAATEQFTNRCRFSQNGTPLVSADVNAWREDIPGKGGFIDAPVKEAIISCAFIKDRLIVYFERSTWELSYTQNQVLPFVWQRINSELGAESIKSAVSFDKVVMGIGQTGIHACNGANVERIDQKIPDSVFDISNDDSGVERVCGIRDYFTQMVYWAYPYRLTTAKYPNRILVYNYLSGSWSIFKDSITAFGYYQPGNGLTWDTWKSTWDQSVAPWGSGQDEAKFLNVVAGNQQGFVFLMHPDYNGNASVLQITNATDAGNGWVSIIIYDHNMLSDSFVYIDNCQGIAGINNKIYKVNWISEDEIWIQEPAFAGVYTGAGTAAIVSNIDIKTKQYNFYIDQGRNAYISKVDFYVDKTDNGQVTVNCFMGDSEFNVTQSGQATGALLGQNGILETSPYALVPFEAQMDQLWHPIYPQMDGQTIQLQITMSEEQITNVDIAFDDFQMHAMTFYATPTTSRLQ